MATEYVVRIRFENGEYQQYALEQDLEDYFYDLDFNASVEVIEEEEV